MRSTSQTRRFTWTAGRWEQTGRKVMVIDTNPVPFPKWEGEINATGKTMKLTNDMVGVFTYVRQ